MNESIRTVTVFGASGRQGQAQVRRLLEGGYWTRAVSRHASIFHAPGFDAAGVMPADYADAASLARACRGSDAVFFQPPQAERPDRVLAFTQSLCAAAHEAGVRRFVLNSTMWGPDQPCGQPMYDLVLAIEEIVAASRLPFVILRPTVFMDNWLTAFALPSIVNEHKYRYPHKPTLRYSPLALDDLALFMVAALAHDAWLGRRVRVAGPETLTPPQVAAILTEAMGVPIAYEYQSPLDFGRAIWDLVGQGTGLDRDTYAGYFADFYTFNNDAPQKPFEFDVAPLLKGVPLKLETFREWALRQDWRAAARDIGSASG